MPLGPGAKTVGNDACIQPCCPASVHCRLRAPCHALAAHIESLGNFGKESCFFPRCMQVLQSTLPVPSWVVDPLLELRRSLGSASHDGKNTSPEAPLGGVTCRRTERCQGATHSVQFSRSVVSDSLRPHELQHARPPCPSPTPGDYPNSCLLSR